MDPRRRQMLREMQIIDWQLRHPERLAQGGPVARLGVQGPTPAWIGDLCLALGLAADAWTACEPGEDTSRFAWLLCLGAEASGTASRVLHCSWPADGQAKRQLWQQICARHA